MPYIYLYPVHTYTPPTLIPYIHLYPAHTYTLSILIFPKLIPSPHLYPAHGFTLSTLIPCPRYIPHPHLHPPNTPTHAPLTSRRVPSAGLVHGALRELQQRVLRVVVLLRLPRRRRVTSPCPAGHDHCHDDSYAHHHAHDSGDHDADLRASAAPRRDGGRHFRDFVDCLREKRRRWSGVEEAPVPRLVCIAC